MNDQCASHQQQTAILEVRCQTLDDRYERIEIKQDRILKSLNELRESMAGFRVKLSLFATGAAFIAGAAVKLLI